MPWKDTVKQREAAKVYYHKHKEKCLALSREWLKKHPEKRAEYRERRKRIFTLKYKTDPVYREKIRESRRQHQREVWSNLRLLRTQIFREHGNKCDKCGFTDLRALEIHHHFGNNDKKSSYRSFKEIVEKKVPISVLCANCHTILHNHRKDN